MTPEEKQLIEKIPTASLSAYDFYQRGRAEHEKYWSDNNNKLSLRKAEDLYHKALENDSSFANAYQTWHPFTGINIFMKNIYLNIFRIQFLFFVI